MRLELFFVAKSSCYYYRGYRLYDDEHKLIENGFSDKVPSYIIRHLEEKYNRPITVEYTSDDDEFLASFVTI